MQIQSWELNSCGEELDSAIAVHQQRSHFISLAVSICTRRFEEVFGTRKKVHAAIVFLYCITGKEGWGSWRG
ncbi:MAG: hypothetical protein KME32_29675 [Mojavia pulchra JT2-VF2]|uniref:Uncharacterized protein n=1 Tax=Mojavia pulchra JT2-VF2 TaxID=287848 RepID=A0A951UKA0_9NOST|nr:hypothetical protein [Mojavia pulchra JT2-VF2]